jgi:catechol 2,3-dioxygenase-like lactoylglutathione lyase family enzyme
MHAPETVALPVRDVARAVGFYRDRAGFELEHESVDAGGWLAILTPPGPGSAIVVGDLPELAAEAPGSQRGLGYVVDDVAEARREMLARGVACSSVTAARGRAACFGFRDPDGNTWAVREPASAARRSRALGRFLGRRA